jgi:3-mercaptopyruvate sulfurtransferase SseA
MWLVTLMAGAALAAASPSLSIVKPADLVARLKLPAKSAERPTVLHVGPEFNFKDKHVPGAIYAGLGATPAGLQKLRATAKKLDRKRPIVLYCGCCAWSECPNFRPPVAELKKLGFQDVRVLHLPDDFLIDWVRKGHPVARGG